MNAGTSAATSEPALTQLPAVPRAPRLPKVRSARRRLHRLSLDQYERMIESGILTEHDPVILLDGLLVSKMTKGYPHTISTKLVGEELRRILPAGWHVGKEDPIELPEGPVGYSSVPEPDATVLRGAIRDYFDRNPRPADVALVVEIAESSLRDDRKQLVRYAWSMIPFVWIVNLMSRVVEVYSGPTGPGPDPRYQTAQTFAEDAEVAVQIDGREVGKIRVRDLIP